MSNKVYDVLKKEQIANLPFNCDGCMRIIPKLKELGSIMNDQKQQLERYEAKMKDLETTIDSKIDKQVEKAIEMYREREERKCNVIMHNIPEPTTDNKKREEEEKIRDIFAAIKCDEIVPKSLVRLGRPVNGRNRLVKLTLESVSCKHKLLGSTKYLRAKNGDGNVTHGWSNVFITPDLTKEERDKNKKLREELKKRKEDEKNEDLIIYRGVIVDRKGIKGGGAGNDSVSRPVQPV
ncbi:MAG: hypothetical protein AB2693_17445 [Candidatus Thiodiazotropha sp.]